MGVKNNIDRLFQEKLKDFECSPKPKVWNAIEKKLQNKKRKTTPVWWFFSGVASALIAFIVLYPFLNINKSNTPEFTIGKPNIETKNSIKIPNLLTSPSKQQTSKLPALNTKLPSKNTREKGSLKKASYITENTLLNTSKKLTFAKVKNPLSQHKVNTENTLYNTDTINKNNRFKRDSAFKKLIKKEKLKDITTSAKPALVAKKQYSSKWSVSPVLALTHTNSFVNSSALDKSLQPSNTNGGNTFAYGVKLARQIHKKWTIQSGLLIQNISYINTNLSILGSVKNSFLQNIDYTSEPVLIVSSERKEPNADADNTSTADVESTKASLEQFYSYIEIPVELKYTFLENKKLSSKLVGGFSSLLLSENKVNVSSKNYSKLLGRANNLNSVNFSGNMGIDLQYSASKKIKLSINPMFKIQLNTFSRNSNGFKPYIIGVHSGLIYQF
ncbi:MAG: hypothetical protein ACK5H1_01240 [Tenacibaculum sp.]